MSESELPKSTDAKKTRARGKAFQSKLLPYAKQIAEWQIEGRTYREMSELLLARYGLSVHLDTINSFVLVRVKPRLRRVLPVHLFQAETQAINKTEPGGPIPTQPARVMGSDGKEIRNAQYGIVDPENL